MVQIYFFRIFLFSLLIVSMTGCVQAGPTGQWIKSDDGAAAFRNRTLLPNHTYYFIGNEVTPESIIAVDNRYTLKTNVWSSVDISQEILDDWMYWIDTRLSLACPYYGGTILTPDGEAAGFWYSRKRISVVRAPEPGILEVYPPYNPSTSLCARQERRDDR